MDKYLKKLQKYKILKTPKNIFDDCTIECCREHITETNNSNCYCMECKKTISSILREREIEFHFKDGWFYFVFDQKSTKNKGEESYTNDDSHKGISTKYVLGDYAFKKGFHEIDTYNYSFGEIEKRIWEELGIGTYHKIEQLSKKCFIKFIYEDGESVKDKYPADQIILGYIRVSTRQQSEEGISLEEQEFGIKRYAEQHKLHLAAIYADNGVSGSQKRTRKAFLRMIEDAEEGNSTLTHTIERYGRNVLEMKQTIKELEDKGVKPKDIAYKIDTTTPEGEAMLNMICTFKQYERDSIVVRAKLNHEYRKQKGIAFYRPSIGYKMNPNRFEDGIQHVIDEEQVNVIKQVFELKKRLGNVSPHILAKELNRLEVPRITKTVKAEWDHKAVGRALKLEHLTKLI